MAYTPSILYQARHSTPPVLSCTKNVGASPPSTNRVFTTVRDALLTDTMFLLLTANAALPRILTIDRAHGRRESRRIPCPQNCPSTLSHRPRPPPLQQHRRCCLQLAIHRPRRCRLAALAGIEGLALQNKSASGCPLGTTESYWCAVRICTHPHTRPLPDFGSVAVEDD